MNASSAGAFAPFQLPLPRYADNAFEPLLSRNAVRRLRQVQQAHVDTVNAALREHDAWLGQTIEALLRRSSEMPAALKQVVLASGAGHANHQFFWKIVRPAPLLDPSGPLLTHIVKRFGSFDAFRTVFKDAVVGLGGDGWVFLVMDPANAMHMDVIALPGDASVLPLGKAGLLVCNVWRHAWAGDYANPEEWLEAFWLLVDWEVVATRHTGILAGLKQL